jgi:hypothetical protein
MGTEPCELVLAYEPRAEKGQRAQANESFSRPNLGFLGPNLGPTPS